MKMLNVITSSIVSLILAGIIGWTVAGLGGVKLAFAIVFMFAMTAAVIIYAINGLEAIRR